MKHPDATKTQAAALFRQGWSAVAIAREIGVGERTVRQWRDIEGWAVSLDPEQALDARMTWLINKADKSQAEWNELKRLHELRNTLVRRERKEALAAHSKHEGATGGRRGGKRSKTDTEVGHIDVEAVDGPPRFSYQHDFEGDPARVLFWIKSRQIGFTWDASWWALCDAIETGRNKIFLSASKAQVGVFRDYIRALALEYFDLELKGSKEKIALVRNGKPWATFHFLSTNTATAQSYHGDVVIDEACWIPQYETLRKVAGAMASQKQYRIRIFSTPSTVAHPAWQEFKRLSEAVAEGKAKRVSVRTLTIHDAVAAGCDLFDLEALREEYDESAFAQLFECQPLDDEQSIFKLAQLEALQVDPATWKAPGPLPVYLGYDPSRFHDSASLHLLVKMPPSDAHPRGKWRLWKRSNWKGKSFRWQAEQIRQAYERYNVQGVAIDTSGMGQAVYELVSEFIPHAKLKAITYTLEVKADLVQGMRDLVDTGALELPLGDSVLLASFLAIKQVPTQGGRITFKASRTATTGHADAFFSAAHAVSFEPLRPRKRRMIISG